MSNNQLLVIIASAMWFGFIVGCYTGFQQGQVKYVDSSTEPVWTQGEVD